MTSFMPCSANYTGVVLSFVMVCIPAIAAVITEDPVSVTALIGTNAQFHCAGTGVVIIWEVDGLTSIDPNVTSRGITSDDVSSSGTVQSTLTVPATSVNNGTTVRCILFFSSSGSTFSNNSTLTVLPGIGRVLNLRFNPSFSEVLWDPPSTAGVLSNLYYQVTLINNVNNEVILNKTTENTFCPLSTIIQPCQYYTANVTAFSSEYHGDSVVYEQRAPGGYYNLQSLSGYVTVNSNGVFLSVEFNLKVPSTTQLCSGQRLTFATYPQSNTSDVIIRPDYDIVSIFNANHSITEGINEKKICTAVISVVSSEGAVNVLKLNFSTFSVQHCDVHTDHTSYILVECAFAINSTAPGFVLIQDEHSHYTINTTLQRHEGDVSKGSANITDLPAGEYRVTVYDEMKDYVKNVPAYVIPELINVVPLTDPNPLATSTISPVLETGPSSAISGSSMNLIPLSNSVTPTTTNLSPTFNSIGIIIGVVTSAVSIILTLIVILSMLYSFTTHRLKTATLVPVSWTRENHENNYVSRVVVIQQPRLSTFNMTNPVNESAYMELRSDYLSATSPTAVVGTHNESTNPPAASLSTQPVVYADFQQSTNPPAAPPPTQPVVYAEVKQSTNQPAAPTCTSTQPVVDADPTQEIEALSDKNHLDALISQTREFTTNPPDDFVNTHTYTSHINFIYGYEPESDEYLDDNSSPSNGFEMELQNENISAFICGPSIFPMEASKNQRLQSVQYGLTEDEDNPGPTCQDDNSEFLLSLEDNILDTHATCGTSYGISWDLSLVPQQDILIFYVFLIDFPSISSQNDTNNDELLANHSAMKPNKNAKLRTGIVEWLYHQSTYFQKAGSLSFEHSASDSGEKEEDSIAKWRSKLFHNHYSCVSAAWITPMRPSWFYKQFQLLATEVETVLQGHLFSGGSMTAVALPKMLHSRITMLSHFTSLNTPGDICC